MTVKTTTIILLCSDYKQLKTNLHFKQEYIMPVRVFFVQYVVKLKEFIIHSLKKKVLHCKVLKTLNF